MRGSERVTMHAPPNPRQLLNYSAASSCDLSSANVKVLLTRANEALVIQTQGETRALKLKWDRQCTPRALKLEGLFSGPVVVVVNHDNGYCLTSPSDLNQDCRKVGQGCCCNSRFETSRFPEVHFPGHLNYAVDGYHGASRHHNIYIYIYMLIYIYIYIRRPRRGIRLRRKLATNP